MRRILHLLLGLLLAASVAGFPAVPATAGGAPPATASDDVAAGTVLVRLAPSLRPAGSDAGALDGWVETPVLPGETPAGALRRLRHTPGVAAVAYNYRYAPAGTASPNDPGYGQQWHLPHIGIPAAWGHGRGAGVTVAVLDTGVASAGEDLLTCRSFVAPYDAATGATGAAAVDDADGHGTHVAGTIAQCTDNSVGVAGVAPEVDLMPVKVADATGTITSSYLADGITWAVDHGADVLNISLGRTCAADWPACEDPVVDGAISAAVAAGVVVVVASGNEGAPYVSSPANGPDAIAVGAVTSIDTLASYSNHGTDLTLVAPGGNDENGDKVLDDLDGNGIPDGILQETFSPTAGGRSWGYYYYLGTSMATPQVAGAAALMLAADPALTPTEVTDLLTSTAVDLGAAGWDSSFGAGLLRVDAAVEAAYAAATAGGPGGGTAVELLGGTGAVSDTVAAAIAALTGSTPTRRAGADRYGTAAAVSAASFAAGVPAVYVATGENFPDALAAGPAAAAAGGPILLVRAGSIPQATRDELARLAPQRIVVVGGSGVVSDAVAAGLAAYAPTVTRLAGADRYGTAVAVSQDTFDPGVTAVYLVTGEDFPDALAAGAAAAHDGGPVLLTRPDTLPAATRDELLRLAPTRVVVVGGSAVVSDAVLAAVMDLGLSVMRLAGSDRYATAAAVSQATFLAGTSPLYVATGEGFADALAGVAAAGAADAPMLLTRPGDLPAATAAEITRLAG